MKLPTVFHRNYHKIVGKRLFKGQLSFLWQELNIFIEKKKKVKEMKLFLLEKKKKNPICCLNVVKDICFSCFCLPSFVSHLSSCHLYHLWPSPFPYHILPSSLFAPVTVPNAYLTFFFFIFCLQSQNKFPYLWKIYTISFFFFSCFWIIIFCWRSSDLHLW